MTFAKSKNFNKKTCDMTRVVQAGKINSDYEKITF